MTERIHQNARPGRPVRLAVVGCGAVAELYAAPALAALAASGHAEVVAAVDPDAARAGRLAARFPGARVLRDAGDVHSADADAALLCSPARFHADQAVLLLGRGLAVWCEKPMADSAAGCAAMVRAASAAGRTLAVGHVRRHAGALGLARAWIRSGRLGAVRRVTVEEGGPFEWPAATPSFFDRRTAGGGVFLDAGVHVLDILFWWLGEPARCAYADDACGNLEANARADFTWADGATAHVHLSREWRTDGVTRVTADSGELVWRIHAPDRLEVALPGLPPQEFRATSGPQACPWSAAYAAQLRAFVAHLAGDAAAHVVTGAEAAVAVAWIERCYNVRTPLAQPWLDAAEADAFARRAAAAPAP